MPNRQARKITSLLLILTLISYLLSVFFPISSPDIYIFNLQTLDFGIFQLIEIILFATSSFFVIIGFFVGLKRSIFANIFALIGVSLQIYPLMSLILELNNFETLEIGLYSYLAGLFLNLLSGLMIKKTKSKKDDKSPYNSFWQKIDENKQIVCGYCGISNDADFENCIACGRKLPKLKKKEIKEKQKTVEIEEVEQG